MGKIIGLALPVMSFIVFALLYLIYDSKGYHYGFGCNFCNKSMPYNLKPHDGFDFSFTLKDDDGFELVGIGFRYRKSSFKINDFLAYGYNDTSVIIKCTDSLNNIKYLTSYETGYKSKKGNPEISFKDLSNSNFQQVREKYQWVEVDEEKGNSIRRTKFLSMLGILLSLFFIIRKSLKLINTKATH